MIRYNIVKKDMDEVINHILKKEGGYVDDKDDSGGVTNYGITQKSWNEYPSKLKTLSTRVKNISKEDAYAYYIWRFHKKKIPLLPQELWLPVFDFEVNAGRNAIECLQKIINDYNQTLQTDLKVDGIIGEKTKNLIDEIDDLAFEIVRQYTQSRIGYYFHICWVTPNKYKFLRGWVNRAMDSFVHEREKNG